MFDLRLRSVKESLFMPCCRYIPSYVTPFQITAAAFLAGVTSALFAAHSHIVLSLSFWSLNRVLDCLDGSLARHRGTASDLGGFLDLLSDFVIYSLLPIAVALGNANFSRYWPPVAILEATFHVNNFVLFYAAAVAEKYGAQPGGDGEAKAKATQLTSLSMMPALVEGVESATFFTAMLAYPRSIEVLSWTMSLLVALGTLQRILYLVQILR